MSAIKKDIKNLLSVSILDKGLVLLRGIVLLRVLSPELFGLINLINQIKAFSKYGDLGFTAVVERDYNYYEGQEGKNLALVKNVGYTAELFSSIAVFLVIVLASISYRENNVILIGLISGAFAYLFQKLIRIYNTELRITLRFQSFSKVLLGQSLLSNGLVIGLVFVIGVYAPLIIPALASLTLTLILIRKFGYIFNITFDRIEFIRQIKVGLKLGGLTILTGLAVYSERFVILKYFDLEILGYFALFFFIITTFQQLTYDFVRPLMPRARKAIGQGNWIKLVAITWRPTFISIPVLLMLGILGIWLLPILIESYFTKYIPVLGMINLMLPIIYFLGVSAFTGYLLYSAGINKTIYAYAAHISYILILLSTFLLFNENDVSYENLALMFLLAHATRAFVQLFGAAKIFKKTWRAMVYAICIILIPLGLVLSLNFV